MTFEHEDARLRVPKDLALKLAEIAKEDNITGRYAWGTLARKVLYEFVEAREVPEHE
jgi:hypothetical protein